MSLSKQAGRGNGESSRSADANAVGYKRPPANTRFMKGRSGNPHGRPQGRRNVANMTKDLLNRPVRVRSGGETLEMRAIEAIFRVLANKAAQGNVRATSLVNKLREMGGWTNEITEEEWEKRCIRLPRTFTPEEQDLLRAPARDKDRQRYLALAESDETASEFSGDAGTTAEIIPPAIKAGDELAAQGKFDAALAAYRSQLALCKSELTADSNNKSAQYNFRRGVARIGLVADALLLAGDFASALKIADEAMAEAASEFWIAPEPGAWHLYPNTVWINNILAHALMFLGQVDKARAYFLGFHTEMREVYTCWELVTVRDFLLMRRMGYSHPLMDEIENHYAALGWVRDTTEDIPPRVDRGLNHAADIELGDTLAKKGKLDDAIVVYRRILGVCNTDLEKDTNNTPARAELNFVAGRIGYLARGFLLFGNFGEALSCANEALCYDQNSTLVNLNRAHALMLLGRVDDARAIYVEYHGKRMLYTRTVQDAIKDDFETLRKAGHSHWLMIDVERQFDAAIWGERLSGTAGGSGADLRDGADGQSMKAGSRSQTPAPAVRANAIEAKDSITPLSEREDIEAGHTLLSEGRFDEALEVYKRRVKRCDKILANGVPNMQASGDRHIVVNKVSEIALRYVLAGQYEKALATLDYAMSVVPLSAFANVRRAHVLMFLGKKPEARALYLQYREQRMTPEQTGANVILQDLKRMREFERADPLMEEIETLISESNPEQHRRLIR